LSNSEYGFEYQIFCYRYFSYGKFPTMTIRPESIDNSLKITIRGVFTQRILFCWILPGLLDITGVIILIRRKRK
jgi:ABC-2 type transport system permease protein